MSQAARFIIVQTLVPEYRAKVFAELYRRSGGELAVWSGASSPGHPEQRQVRNRYLLGRRFLWQSGHLRAALRAEVCVVEFSPRILTNWIILAGRRLQGRRSFVWGHLFPRAGEHSRSRWLRFLMLRLASGANLYTRSDGEKFRALFPHKAGNVSFNAVMWARECRAAPTPRRRLLFVARMVPDKKPLLLLEAFAQALPRLPADIHLEFVGGGPLEPALHARVAELGLGPRVTVRGALYETEDLRSAYDQALASFSPGYVGLSATQSFGFGVPMLIARDEKHSVEIELCRENFNCAFFPSDSPAALADTIVEFVSHPPAWSQRHEEISAALRASYTLDHMCDGFMRLFAPPAAADSRPAI